MIDISYFYVCAIAFAAMFGGALIGIRAARALPRHHLSSESAAVVKLSAAIVVSITSLVLALLLSSASSSFSTSTAILKKLSSDLIHLDHMLRIYGPDANEARATLRTYVAKKNEELFPSSGGPTTVDRETADLLDALLDSILSLSPADRRQAALISQAQAITTNIYAERWLLWENPGAAVPLPFLFVLIFWLSLIFASFGLFAPVNATVITSFLLTSLAVTGAIFLMLDLGDPVHHGMLKISGDPLLRAMFEVGRP